MAPEAPGNLVVVDSRIQNQELTGYVERVEYPPEQLAAIEATKGWFIALWNETPKGGDYVPLGGGVVYVNEKQLPPGYKFSPKSAFKPDPLGNDRYAYHYPALGEGLMFVLILPEGYTLTDSRPMPMSAKIQKKKRLAVYWQPPGKYGASVKITWQIKRFDGDLSSERNRINADREKSANVPDNRGVIFGEPVRREDTLTDIHKPQRLAPMNVLGVALGTLGILALLTLGLVWIAKQISSIPLLVLIYCVTAIFSLILVAVVLLISGHLSEKLAEKLFIGVLGKIPGLDRWISKFTAKK
jgi:hypothetical protein